jgi:hypothetical protein
MARIEVRDATHSDILYVARHIREEDRREIAASCLMDPKHIMLATYRQSGVARCGTVDGEPVVVFGVAENTLLGSGCGIPWLIGTPKIYEHERAFLRRNKRMVYQWIKAYGRLSNYVDARNHRAIKWLEWLGFKMEEAKPYGPLGRPFHRFSMELSDVYDGSRHCRLTGRDGGLGDGADAVGERAGCGG